MENGVEILWKFMWKSEEANWNESTIPAQFCQRSCIYMIILAVIMVARDGVEPPTPAFSVCSYPAHSTTCRLRTAAEVLLTTCKSDLLWVALWVADNVSQTRWA